MPYQDGTGPRGMGQLTGRGFGPCERGLRRGFGMGFGFRCMEPVNLSKEEEKKY